MLSVTLIVKGAFTCLAASATATILYAGEQPDTLSAFDIGGIYSEELIRVGINESGGEFGSGILPGEFGVNYDFINQVSYVGRLRPHLESFRVRKR